MVFIPFLQPQLTTGITHHHAGCLVRLRYSMPQIGEAAPEFKAITTQGGINFPADYKGS
jgi:hypothetical protein